MYTSQKTYIADLNTIYQCTRSNNLDEKNVHSVTLVD